MKTIWKYEVEADDQVAKIVMPRGAEIVHVGFQTHRNIDICTFWVLVEPSSMNKEVRNFIVRGTGQPIDTNEVYVGTAIVLSVPLVWHLFEIKERS